MDATNPLDPDDPLAVPTPAESEESLQTQRLLLAAAHHDIPQLRALLRSGVSANVQDPETGMTPLHAAISGASDVVSSTGAATAAAAVNGASENGLDSGRGDSEQQDPAQTTLSLLFQNGAIWNDVDANGETPGCLAWRLGLRQLYERFVDAGVRAELLLGRLEGYEVLGDEGDDGEDEEDGEGLGDEVEREEPQLVTEEEEEAMKSNAGFLSAPLSFGTERILDRDGNGVMMSWERDVMRRSVEALLPERGLCVLNIGHGMGIIDSIIQESANKPASHHIVEAHPDVLAKMKEKGGWLEQRGGCESKILEKSQNPTTDDAEAEEEAEKGTILHAGRWQDVLPALVAKDVTFDAIYFDTFAEDYKAFRDFFSEYVIALLKPEGRWSFFHGLGADRRVCYDVYTKVVEMDLFEAGFDVEWQKVRVPDLEQQGEWEGVRRKYWDLDEYRLPVCSFVS